MPIRRHTHFTNKLVLLLMVVGASACTHNLTPALGSGGERGGLTPALERTEFTSSSVKQIKSTISEETSLDETMPYDVDGKVYQPLDRADGFSQEGTASWYGDPFHGQATSNKEVYNMHSLTAAHKTLPFHSRVRVTNLENGKEVTVRINDRGPFVGDRIIDLSYKAAQMLGMAEQGTARVRLTVLESGTAEGPKVTLASGPGRVFYSIQLGLFENRQSAERLSRQYGGEVRPVDRNGRPWYQVLVGEAPEYEDAIRLREKLRGQGQEDAFIIRNWRPAPATLNN
ncbi:septal ring lytic transglycosylase RlpA family protein [Nitrospina gracilis]|uniref:septal ring lytic transglycosylase RlpA family protein n=1 Tax=Nitrospina gracilis TaxID=35801 RepID=UPI0023517345|nr:septal ring lytic transglycosylase RlpA family protein [Nitrospina gracilis]MCF8720250.1 rare lipoprotein A [Nitrospina gracilis Nb-211]